MQKELKRLPLGMQTFEEVIEKDCFYVDKTEYIYKMRQLGKAVFLSRPRRFGKSLLVSTLRAYFEGKKEFFKGLAIEKLETEWVEYPVLHFDMSTAKHCDVDSLESEIAYKLDCYERIYGSSGPSVTNCNTRLMGLIERAHQQTGRKVVVLIDEYDAPLLDVVHEDTVLPKLRQVMRNFYSPLKACDAHLEFVFLTGITKFSQLSIFSELNSLANISMDFDFAGICGITQEELINTGKDYIQAIAESYEMSYDEALLQLKYNYDGYHFTIPSPDVYNPFSLVNAFSRRKIESYWFSSGTPTYLIEMMRKFDVLPSQLGNVTAEAEFFDAPTENMTSIIPLLYQSGYLTIKDYDKNFETYTLDIPNYEIRRGLYGALLRHLTVGVRTSQGVLINKMQYYLRNDDIETMLTLLHDFLLTVPYCDNTDYEGHFQQLLFVIFSMLGASTDVEVRTARGRVDMVMQTAKNLYLIEIKINKTAAAALKQIELKDYSSRFALQSLPIVKVGMNFNSETHTIEDWVIED